ncbi:MAG: ankyrin repeat domain-containing protein [Brevinema sp.]
MKKSLFLFLLALTTPLYSLALEDPTAGYDLLQYAKENNTEQVIKTLYYNIDVDLYDMRGEYYQYTPLMHAIRHGNDEMAKVLIDYGANVEAKTTIDETPLKLAIRQKNYSLVKLLIDHGADVNRYAYLSLATRQDDYPIVKLLIDHGANKDNRSEALLSAARLGRYDIAILLLNSGVDLTVSSRGWNTASLASINEHCTVAKLLIDHGVEDEVAHYIGKNRIPETYYQGTCSTK